MDCRRLGTVLLLVTLGIWGGSPRATASTFEAGVAKFNSAFGSCVPVIEGQVALGEWPSTSAGTGVATASAFALGGVVGAEAVSISKGNSTFNDLNGSCFLAEVVIDDILISGDGSEISTTVSADLRGVIESLTPLAGTATGRTIAKLQPFTTELPIVALAGPVQLDTGSVASGDLEEVETTLTTALFDAPVGQPFAVVLTLRGSVVSSGNALNGNPTVSNDFGSTFSFTEGGPVFDLPEGFTVNSIDGNIFDNVFVSPILLVDDFESGDTSSWSLTVVE